LFGVIVFAFILDNFAHQGEFIYGLSKGRRFQIYVERKTNKNQAYICIVFGFVLIDCFLSFQSS